MINFLQNLKYYDYVNEPMKNKLCEVQRQLQRGEKFEQMWKKIRDDTSQYDRGSDVLDLIYKLEQKYFPKVK